MLEEFPITREQLEHAQVTTAPKMGFMFDDGGNPILESRYTLAQIFVSLEGRVKFILAKEEIPLASNQSPVHLGIFYPSQPAATTAYALCYHIAGNTGKFAELAQRSTELCYGTMPHVIPAKRQSPVIEWTRLIGGGEINSSEGEDKSFAHTLQTNFGLSDIPPEYMGIIRGLILQELLAEHRV